MLRRIYLLGLVVSVLIPAFAPGTGLAAPLQFRFVAEIDSIEGSATANLVGDRLEGWLLYDTDTPITSGPTTTNFYAYRADIPTHDIQIDLGPDGVWSPDRSGVMSVAVTTGALGSGPVSGHHALGTTIWVRRADHIADRWLLNFFLWDSTAAVFDSVDLPANLDLADFDRAELTIDNNQGRIRASVVELSLIPEPGTASLLALGLLALAVRGRRRG